MPRLCVHWTQPLQTLLPEQLKQHPEPADKIYELSLSQSTRANRLRCTYLTAGYTKKELP